MARATKPAKKPTAPKKKPVIRIPKPGKMPARTTAEERWFAEQAIAKVAGANKDAAIAQLRAAIPIYTTREAKPLPVGVSKYGGIPDLAKGTSWPRVGGAPMEFVAQFALADLGKVDVDHRLPRAGLLSFFYEWRSREIAVVHSTLPVERAAWPKELGKAPVFDVSLRFRTRFELPTHYNVVEPMVDPTCLRRKGSIDPDSGQLLGYDFHMGYDKPLAKGTSLLFRCASDDQAGMNYGDAQDIAFRIRDEDLVAGRFDRVELWCQSG